MGQPQHARLAVLVAVCGIVLAGAAPVPAMLSGSGSSAVRHAPKNTSPPVVSGTPRVGSVLTASPGSWSGSPTYGYQWRHCDAAGGACWAIAGATATTYTPTSNDVGATLRVAVTATNSAGSTVAVSAATAAVQSASTAPPAPSSFDPL